MVITILILNKTSRCIGNRHFIMRKYVNKAKRVLVDTSCAVLGAGHFVAQTSADSLMSIEARLKMKSTGEVPEDIKKERMLSTIKRQRWILDRYEAASKRMSMRNRHKTVSGFVDKDSLEVVAVEHYQMNPSLIIKS